MSMIDKLQNALAIISDTSLNRYRLNIPSCLSPLDVEDFSGSEAMSRTYHYDILFTSADQDIDATQLLSKPANLTMGTGLLQSLTEHEGSRN